MKILALDTATEVCSVALLLQDTAGSPQLLVRELPPGAGHSAHILSLVQAVLSEASLSLRQLDCIAFGRGPGGFTGVRLAASVTQGLAYGADLQVLPVSDLLAVAQQALDLAPSAASVLVCNDARMQEMYWTCATRGPSGLALPAGPEQVGPPDTVKLQIELPSPVHAAGRGFAVWPLLPQRLGVLLSPGHAELLPRAREIARLAAPQWLAGQGVEPDRAQPVYLRNDVAKPSRK
ncbi:MAG TPA: tRNA (adenosine(37)-N6)-threonylcarbamoyltransferase complex dimerization subunit type 1 TsaB [Steroidobacteraceae bacterium]|nr:tRNA (adenosine(37)-N6)-threonylcarbamoyltransferase complex dimerization subunit type 1 TsaB [Steroidobacteraceae bacterium]